MWAAEGFDLNDDEQDQYESFDDFQMWRNNQQEYMKATAGEVQGLISTQELLNNNSTFAFINNESGSYSTCGGLIIASANQSTLVGPPKNK